MYGSQRNDLRLAEGLESILVKVGHSNSGCKLQQAQMTSIVKVNTQETACPSKLSHAAVIVASNRGDAKQPVKRNCTRA